MKEKRIPIFIAIGLVILAIMGLGGWLILRRMIPTKEPADLEEVLGVSGEELWARVRALEGGTAT